jgi:hypothetical protein
MATRWKSSLAGVLLLAGCSSQAPLAPSSIQGTYVLQTVNGSRLPVTISQDASSRIEIVASTVFLNSDQICHISTSRQRWFGDRPELDTQSVRGTYSVNGVTITVPAENGATYRFLAGNGTLTQSDAGLTLVYQR